MIIGIDLGTTNSLAAYMTEDGPKIIPNRLGNNLTPSVVAMDKDGNICVGETAKEMMYADPTCAASVFKRSMGTDKEFYLSGKRFKAEELSSFVLRSLKEDAEALLGEKVEEAVISVPAYFNDFRRKAVKRAGKLAGLNVERIIAEPTAAAMAYGLYKEKRDIKAVVFDLGGGTFDISILMYFAPILEIHAVAGDNFLGGEDFTKVIEEMFLQKCDLPVNIADNADDRFVVDLYKEAERCKRAITDTDRYKMSVKKGDKTYTAEITRTDFEKECAGLYERLKVPIRKALSDAKIKLSEIDKVVPVGGATRMPGIRSFLAKTFNCFPDISINPDEIVAVGAAIQAGMKERNDSVKEVILTDVCPFTLGTEVSVRYSEFKYEDNHYCPIIERNTVIPASRTDEFYTIRDHQTKLDITVLQGESRIASENLTLGHIVVPIPDNKAGEEGVKVTFTYDINSILEVEVTVMSTGKKYREVIKGIETDMTDEEIDKRFEELAYLKLPPREQERNRYIFARAERLFMELVGMDRERLENYVRLFEAALDSGDESEINYKRSRLEEVMDEFDN